MAYINCERAGFSFESILQSMFAYDGDTLPRIAGLRVLVYDDTYSYLPECDRFEDWKDLFREALDIGADGLPVLRLVYGTISETAPDCEDWQTVNNLARMAFVKLDTTDEVALLLLSEQ